MSEKITVTYYISDEGWVYTDSFGVAMLEGRADRSTGITERHSRHILTLPREVDGMEVYIVSFDAEYDNTVTDVVIPGGVGIIGPKAFSGTAIPHRVQKKLYERELCVTESPEEVKHP